MANKYIRGGMLRITALTAALLGVYGVAGAAPLTCDGLDACTGDITGDHSLSGAGQQWTVTGINGANFTLKDGSVTASGNGVRGVLASGNDTFVKVNGTTIETDGSSGHGVQAYGIGSNLKIDGTRITLKNAAYAVGVAAQEGGVVTGSNNLIVTNGEYGSGVEVDRGGAVSLSGGNITTNGVGAAGARAISGQQPGATAGSIRLDGTVVQTTGESGVGLMAGDEDGKGGARTAGNITFINGMVTTSGADAFGARVHDSSSLYLENSELTSGQSNGLVVGHKDAAGIAKDNTAIVKKTTIKAGGTHGVYVSEGNVTLENSTVINTSTTLKNAKGVTADYGAKATVSGTNVQVSASGDGTNVVVGVQALEGGSVILNGGSKVSTTGDYAYGIRSTLDRARDPSSTAVSSISASSTSVNTSGANSHGMAAYWWGTINADNVQVATTGANAYGIDTRDHGKVTLANSSVTTSGAGSVGVRAEAIDATRAAGSLVISNSAIQTTGANAHGVGLYGGGSALDMTGGSISATGKDSAGLFVSNQGRATLTGVKVTSAGPSIISRFRRDSTQTFNLGADTYLTDNNGTLLLVKREEGGENGTVTLNLNPGSFAAGNVYDKDAANKVTVGKNGGHWAGIVVDANTKTVGPDSAPESNFTTPGSVQIAAAPSGPTTFTGDTNIGGSVSLDPSASTVFQGSTTIVGDLAGQQGASTQFNGATTINQSVAGAQNSTFVFSGPSTTIGGSIAGTTGSTMSFAGGATIGGNVEAAGEGGSFVFSQTAPTTIGGSVQIGQGASVKGGTVGTPIQIAGNAVVNSGAILGGNLVVQGALTGTGGTLSPGNSIGSHTYGTSGKFTGTYKVEVNSAGKSDLVTITNGNLNLAGIDLLVSQENGNGGYLVNHDYTIIQTASGNVEGEFKTSALDSTFAGTVVNLDPVKYSQKDVKVSLSVDSNKVKDARAGLSSNQNATLDGALSVAGQNASASAALSDKDLGAALNQLSGEAHASTQSALLNSGSLLSSTISKRMRGNVGAGMVAGAPVAQSSSALPAGAMPSSAAHPLWAEVVGNWSTLKGNDNAAKVKNDMGGLFLGGDVGVGKGWRLGASLGYTDSKIKANDRDSRSDVRSYTAAVYGGNSWATGKGSVNFLAGAGYTRHDIDSRRNVTLGGGQTLKADYKANTAHLFTELGYAVPVGKASVVEPYLGLAWINQRTKGFSESGGSAALAGESQTDSVTTFTLGARGKTAVTTGSNEVRLTGGLGWRHAAGDIEASRKVSFIQGNGATFKVSGAPIAKNAAVVDLGAEMTLGKNAAMGLAYSGQFGNGNTDNTGSLYLKYRFK